MSRKLERQLTKWLGIWQIIDGLITIIIYGTHVRLTGIKGTGVLDFQTANALNSIFGSMYMFIVTFGVLLIGIGLFNVYLGKTFLRDNVITYKMPIYLLVVGILSYACMDIISVALAIVSGIVALSKNKALKERIMN